MPPALIFVALAVVFAFVLSVAQGIYWAWVARQEKEQDEILRRLTGGGTTEDVQESLLREEENDRAAAMMGNFGKGVQQLITQADSQLSVSSVFMRMAGLGVAGTLGGLIFVGAPGLVFGLPAAYAPYFYLGYTATARSNKLVSQIPDAMDLMARSLQAGVGLNDAFRLVAEEMPMPISIEFGRVFEEVRFGRDYREAFGKMLERNPGVFDLRLMVSSILLQRETGGNLIEILESIGNTVRARFTFQGKVRAMTAEAKFSALVLGSLPLAVMTILTFSSPDYLTPLFEDPIGNVILLVDFMMYAGGIMIMRDMINVEV
jgi:tight adherence protein B